MKDRATALRVGAGMRTRLLLALTLALAGGAACGGKSKGAAAAGGQAQAGGEAGGEGTPGDPGAPGGETAGNGTPGGETPGQAGGETGSDPGEPPGPPIVAPNLDPDPEQARTAVQEHLNAGRLALREGSLDPDRAIASARAALAVDANNIDAVVILAHANYHKKLYDTAEVILDMLFKERPAAKNNAGVYYVYGLVYDKSNEPQKARVAYEKAVELDPNHTSALINLGIHQLQNKQYRDAVRTYEKVTGPLNKANARTWTALGSAYRGQSADYDPGSGERDDLIRKAEAAFKKATSLDRNYGPAYYNLAVLYLDADPYPGNLDTLLRLQRAKGYLDEYKNMPGADQVLYAERAKDVDKLIKREEKARKKAEKEKASGG
jgi:tetratricopeptide (TPR) repeat protein